MAGADALRVVFIVSRKMLFQKYAVTLRVLGTLSTYWLQAFCRNTEGEPLAAAHPVSRNVQDHMGLPIGCFAGAYPIGRDGGIDLLTKRTEQLGFDNIDGRIKPQCQ